MIADLPGLFRHPPVDPVTGAVSVADDAVSLGPVRHCDTPTRFRRDDCTAVMHVHGWIDGPDFGRIVCPDGHTTVPPPPTITRLADV